MRSFLHTGSMFGLPGATSLALALFLCVSVAAWAGDGAAGADDYDDFLRRLSEMSPGDDGVPRLVHVDVHPGGRGHTHLDLRYLVFGGDADPSPPAGESQEIAWFDWPAAIDRASDDRLTALLRHLATPGGPTLSGR